jgi:hypothetical protein
MDAASDKLPVSVWQALSRWGLLLESDKALPSVATIIAEGPISGSWWGHTKGGRIYAALQALGERGDVLCLKLVSGKVTFVHQRLWPAVLAVARAREPWQLAGLTAEAASLLDLVEGAGSIRLDELPDAGRVHREAARDLEHRLLVHGDEIHTAGGAHAKRLESWSLWSSEKGWKAPLFSSAGAQEAIEAAVLALNVNFNARARLPWQPVSS